MPLLDIYIPKFGKISVKFSVLGSHTTNLHRRGCMSSGPMVHYSMPNFTPSVQHVTPAGQKTSKLPYE